MLNLKSITLSGIGRFVEEQTVDFTSLGPLVQVDGENRNTGGSSGSGKSTIFKALEFLLGLNDVSNGVLQSRLTKDTMSVIGIFDLDGVPLKIERGKKLLLDLNGEVTTGSSKLTEEKLDQLIGMDRDLFRKILHKRQGEGGFFLDMTPSEVHKFLTSCMGLSSEQAKIIALDERLFSITKEEIALKSIVESHKAAIEATKTAVLSLGEPPALDINPESLEALKTAYMGALDNHNLVKGSHKRELDDLEKTRPQVTTNPFDRSKIESLENSINSKKNEISILEKTELNRQNTIKSKIPNLEAEILRLKNEEFARQSDVKAKISNIRLEISKLQEQEQQRQAAVVSKINVNNITRLTKKAEVSEGERAKIDASSFAQELSKVRASMCPTCEQPWINDAIKKKEADLLEKLKECKRLIIAGMSAEKEISSLEEQNSILELEKNPKSVPEIDILMSQARQFGTELDPKPIPELVPILEEIEKLKKESEPQYSVEVSNLRMAIQVDEALLIYARKEERDHQLTENAKSQADLDIFYQKQKSLRQTHETTIKYLQEEESKALNEYEIAKNKVANFEESKKRFDDSHKKLSIQLVNAQNELELKKCQLHKIQEEIGLAEESKKVIKSYLSCSFEDALDSIGDTATKFIRNVPNMQSGTIQFEGIKENKDGKLKEEVTCLLSMDGEIGIPVKSLSGGERSSLDLAIDLAVMEFIQERAGKGINLLILDEPFTGLDCSNISCIVELLKESGINKQILVVDHNPIVKETFESKILVVRDGLTSKVMQQ